MGDDLTTASGIQELNFVDISRLIKPDYFVHGTDWRRGVQKNVRELLNIAEIS